MNKVYEEAERRYGVTLRDVNAAAHTIYMLASAIDDLLDDPGVSLEYRADLARKYRALTGAWKTVKGVDS